MEYDRIEWDEANLAHATRHGVTAREIAQAIDNATTARQGREADRRVLRARTDGGRPVVVIVQLPGHGRVRPITAWEDKG